MIMDDLRDARRHPPHVNRSGIVIDKSADEKQSRNRQRTEENEDEEVELGAEVASLLGNLRLMEDGMSAARIETQDGPKHARSKGTDAKLQSRNSQLG